MSFLQGRCSADFLALHRLNGQQKSVAKRCKAPALRAVYLSVLDDPSRAARLQLAVTLAQQVRACEASWACDARGVATGERDPFACLLTGIAGLRQNGALLYGDMCSLGYGQPSPDEVEARRWWDWAARDGHTIAAERLVSGLYDSILHMDHTNDCCEADGWLEDSD